MSTTVRGYGYVARLASKLTKERVEDISEALWETGSNLKLNYEGTLAYYDFMLNTPLSFREDIYFRQVGQAKNSEERKDALKEEAEKYGLFIQDGILPFSCIWHTGTDAPMDLMTLDEFEEILDASD